jgi:hypothetical protein
MKDMKGMKIMKKSFTFYFDRSFSSCPSCFFMPFMCDWL